MHCTKRSTARAFLSSPVNGGSNLDAVAYIRRCTGRPELTRRLLDRQPLRCAESWSAALATAVLLALSAFDLPAFDLSVHAEDIAPAVQLREYDNRVVEEYRVNNQLYMIKITPSVGAPYLLVDDDGSGDMAWRRPTSETERQVPKWVLFSW